MGTKKNRFFGILLGLALAIGMMPALGMSMPSYAADPVFYTLEGSVSGGTNQYATESDITQNDINWKVTGNTVTDGIPYWRIGGKNLIQTDRPIYSVDPLNADVSKVELALGDMSSGSITVNSVKLIVASDASFSTIIEEKTSTSIEKNESFLFTPSAGKEWTNAYYKFLFNVSVTSNSNRYIEFVSAQFNGTESGGTPISDPVPYLDAAGKQQICTDYTVVDSCAATWTDGWYVVNGTVKSGDITVNGNANLILMDDAAMTVKAASLNGINIAAGKTLNIYAQSTGKTAGSLTAKGDAGLAGIHNTGAAVTINGGKVTALGGTDNQQGAAGIGGDIGGAGGTVTVNGGKVIATGGDQAAGIGAGSGNIDHGTVTLAEGLNVMAGDGAPGTDVTATYATTHDQKWALIMQIDKYPLWVGGIQVTSANAEDVLGDADEGATVSFTPAEEGANPGILTLNGANITKAYQPSGSDDTYGIYYEGTDLLEIESADNTINVINSESKPFTAGICSHNAGADIAFTGEGKLTVSGADSAIYGKKNITIQSGAVNAAATGETGNGIFANEGVVSIDGDTVTASGPAGAVHGLVKNSIPGTGWTNVAGTEGKEGIAASTEGQALTYKKVQFPEAEVHTHNDIAFQPWGGANSLPAEAGSYYLLKDVTLASTWDVPSGKTNLCMNGHKVKFAGANEEPAVRLQDKSALDLYDCDVDVTGTITGAATGLLVEAGGTFNMHGGVICGNNGGLKGRGGGVLNQGTFNMCGGAISGNSAKYGGGVFNSAKFSMSGGAICDNVAQEAGGGAYIQKASVKISGDIVVKDNRVGTINEDVITDARVNNLCFLEGSSATIVDALGDTAEIGVSIVDNVDELIEGVFTDSTPDGAKKAKDYIDNFTTDDSEYSIKAEGDELKVIDTAAEDVREMIAALPKSEVVKTEDAKVIAAARAAYEELTYVQRSRVGWDAADELEACEIALANVFADDLSKIEKIDNKEAARAVLDAYDEMTDTEKDTVDALIGRAGVKKIADMKEAIAVIDTIDRLKDLEPIDTKDGEAIGIARTAYELLSDARKALIPAATVGKLATAEKELAAAKAQDELNAAKASALERLDDYSEAKALQDMTEAEKATYDQAVADGKAVINAAADKAAVDIALKEAKAAVNDALAQIEQDREHVRSIKTITVNASTVNAKALAEAVEKAGGSSKYVTTFVLGKKVKKISKSAFKGYKKVKTLTVKTKKLKKASVKQSLKGSKITKVKVKVGKKTVSKEYVKKYKKIFTKKNAGKKVSVGL